MIWDRLLIQYGLDPMIVYTYVAIVNHTSSRAGIAI